MMVPEIISQVFTSYQAVNHSTVGIPLVLPISFGMQGFFIVMPPTEVNISCVQETLTAIVGKPVAGRKNKELFILLQTNVEEVTGIGQRGFLFIYFKPQGKISIPDSFF